MQSKDEIRNRIIQYIQLIWDTSNVERLDMLVRLMVEELASELHLLENKMCDIDTLIPRMLAERLTPMEHLEVRPAHALFHLVPTRPTFTLRKEHSLFLKNIPEHLLEIGISNVNFQPVTDLKLFKGKVAKMVCWSELFDLTDTGEKSLQASGNIRPGQRSVWLGLDIDQGVNNLEGMIFYVDFPRLAEVHANYRLLPYTEMYFGNKKITLGNGLPVLREANAEESECPEIKFYNDHYLHIAESTPMYELTACLLPPALDGIFDSETISQLKPLYWVELKFSHSIPARDLTQMTIAINTFPANNRTDRATKASKDSLSTVLLGKSGEKLFKINSMTDDNGLEYGLLKSGMPTKKGSYRLEPNMAIYSGGINIIDHVEQLIDLVNNEKKAFPAADTDLIRQFVKGIPTGSEGNENKGNKVRNDKNKSKLGRVAVYSYEKSGILNIDYSTTFGSLINGLPAGEEYMLQIPGHTETLFSRAVTEVCGGKEFNEAAHLLAANKYCLISNDRIVSNFSIVCFCEFELGNAIDKVEVELVAKRGILPKQGNVRTIEVRLYPSKDHPEQLHRKGVLKDLWVRMHERSPDRYNYSLVIAD